MNNFFRATLIFFLGLVVGWPANGQSTQVLDNLPPSIKWYQLKTPHFNIIYPAGFGEQGKRMANTMEHIYAPVSQSLGVMPKKNFSLILQNRNSVSNGFVTLGPRHSEFYTMSPQRSALLGNNDWLNMLALHEYRHVVQYDRSRTGLTGLARILFGEYTQAAIASATVPSWFWEGDAVGIETALSKSGRGRIPQFSAAFRANLLEKGPFNYNKAYLRSYKDYIPNHYVLGYFYSTYLKNKYGLESVEQMVDRTWAIPIIPFAFSFAQKKYGGKKMPEMYLSMMTELKQEWQAQQAELQFTKYTRVNSKRKKVYTNYSYPQELDNGNILVLKSGLDDYPQFVEINIETGEEKTVFTPGILNGAEMLSASGGTFTWNEFRFDPRWRQQTYSVIKTYNIGSKYLKTLTEKSRYTAASLSPDRKRIATIEQPTDYSNRLVILNAYNGEVIKNFEKKHGVALTTPVWADDTHITYAEIFDQQKQIVLLNTETSERQILLKPTNEQISYAIMYDDYLFYVSGLTGIDNIYARQISSGATYQVTSARFGAYNPEISADGKRIYYNDVNSSGSDVVFISFDPSQWLPADRAAVETDNFFKPMADMEGNADILESIPEKEYPESRYRKKLLNFHSWGPYLLNSTSEFEAGLYSTNVLSTTDLFVGFRVDSDFNFKWMARASFQAWYPIIDIQADYTKRNSRASYIAQDPADSVFKVYSDRHTWDELGIKGGLRVPWLLTKSQFVTGIELKNYVGLTKVNKFNSDVFGDQYYPFFLNFSSPRFSGNLISNEFSFRFYSLHSQSIRDINSKWGATLTFERYGTPYGGDYEGGLTAIRGQLYVPGLFKHHSLNFFAGYQHMKVTLNNNNYWFANRMPYPRGVFSQSHEDFYTVRTNYDLPLLYPDLSIGPFLYIQRIKAELFFDYGFGRQGVITDSTSGLRTDGNSRTYTSTGTELTFDLNILRALPQIELGVRFNYLPSDGTTSFEFLVGSFGF